MTLEEMQALPPALRVLCPGTGTELYKSTKKYDGGVGREQHGYRRGTAPAFRDYDTSRKQISLLDCTTSSKLRAKFGRQGKRTSIRVSPSLQEPLPEVVNLES